MYHKVGPEVLYFESTTTKGYIKLTVTGLRLESFILFVRVLSSDILKRDLAGESHFISGL